MSKTIYDIFISYRRDGGGATAGRINDMLTADGYSVSYDVDTLREGRFDMQLLERIEQCQDFILVVDKNCFVRTIDPSTDPQDDWLWQELSYALQLKKNVIPVLLAGADFPKKLPEDIDNVRLCHGPRCVHEYFDSFYIKLKEMLRAYPRLAKPSDVEQPLSTNKTACLKLKADIDCIFYLDGEERSHLRAGIILKIPLAKGEYELGFVSEENGNDRLELEFVMPDVDKLQKVNLSDIRDARLHKEAEALRIAEEKRQAEEKKRKEEEERAKERTFTVGGVSFKMIRVEGGSFMMGSPEYDYDACDDEKPQHRVTLSDYYIGETQVTQALWKAVMGDNPSYWKGNSLPVESVSWEDCQKFIKQLNKMTGMTFRLPTEAEWEYTARGGRKSQGFLYPGGNYIDQVAWNWRNSGDKYLEGGDDDWDSDKISKNNCKTHPVKQKYANELGLYDMSGNVWEWCQDWFGVYRGSAQTNPSGPSSGSGRVLRGGCWYGYVGSCFVSSRYNDSPDCRDSGFGFRLALSHQ